MTSKRNKAFLESLAWDTELLKGNTELVQSQPFNRAERRALKIVANRKEKQNAKLSITT